MCGEARGGEAELDGGGAGGALAFFEAAMANADVGCTAASVTIASTAAAVSTAVVAPAIAAAAAGAGAATGADIGAGAGVGSGVGTLDPRFLVPEERLAPPNKATMPDTAPLFPVEGLFGPTTPDCGGGDDTCGCGLGDSKPPNSERLRALIVGTIFPGSVSILPLAVSTSALTYNCPGPNPDIFRFDCDVCAVAPLSVKENTGENLGANVDVFRGGVDTGPSRETGLALGPALAFPLVLTLPLKLPLSPLPPTV
mmetsp:Transcript_100459/g.287607  ORF Transcript_100459/g.287607 Transcript_100459/m.287607 type:complete len:255 (-) Transcript_100459:2929-3693(-)